VAALYRWLGVHEEPSAADLVGRLLQLAEQETEEEDPVQIARRCWRRLQTDYEQGKIAPYVLAPLREKRVIPAGQELTRPSTLFFADTPEVAAHFADLEAHLILPATEAAPVWAMAGVRPLSQAVRAEFVTPAGHEPALALQERIGSRATLIRRIVRTEAEKAVVVDFLDELRVVRATPLQIRYRLSLAGEEKVSGLEPATVALDRAAGLLYVSGDEQQPWLAIAREIARALLGEKPGGGLVLAIKEVLAAETFAAAREMVDALGYPQ
jgi:hypothetical protein